MSPPSTTVPTFGSRSGDWIAGLLLLILSALQVYYSDLTFHGPDQIRDVETVRLWLQHGQWPLTSTPFNGRWYLPPGFYYFLAVPLLIGGDEKSIFVAFGLFYVLCSAYAWHTIKKFLGERAALTFLVVAIPIFGGIYTHSAWNPALAMGMSSLVLAQWIRAQHDPRKGWFWLVLTMFLLVQIHLSAAPLCVALGLYALTQPAVLRHRNTWASIGLVVALTVVWAVLTEPWNIPRVVFPASPSMQADWVAVLSRLFDLGKWWDALGMPYYMIAGIRPAIPEVSAGAAVLVGFMIIGVVLGFVFSVRAPLMRWTALTVLLWWLFAMGFLSHGAFWHLDVIQPWLALLAAYGWEQASTRWSWSHRPWLLTTASIGFLALWGQFGIYRHFETNIKIDLLANTSFFPHIPGEKSFVPSFSYRFLQSMQTYVEVNGICENQLRGQYWMLARDLTNRKFGSVCRNSAANASNKQYLIKPLHNEEFSELTHGLSPVASLSSAVVYEIDSIPLRINDKEAGNLFSDERIDYMTFAPARHDQGINIRLSAEQTIVLQVSLRCAGGTILNSDSWSLVNADLASRPLADQANYMGSNYYKFEWTLRPSLPNNPVTLSTPDVLTLCDVSATARTKAQ